MGAFASHTRKVFSITKISNDDAVQIQVAFQYVFYCYVKQVWKRDITKLFEWSDQIFRNEEFLENIIVRSKFIVQKS